MARKTAKQTLEQAIAAYEYLHNSVKARTPNT